MSKPYTMEDFRSGPAPTPKVPSKVTMVCPDCGSEDVVVDAWAEWCVETQQWVVQTTFDRAFCNACDHEMSHVDAADVE